LAVIQFPIHEVGMKPFEWMRVDGSGEWSVAPPEYKQENWLRLILRERSDRGAVYGTSLFTGGSGESTYLYMHLGDPDVSPPYEFKRETK
jgi:hypothetical protein